MGGKPLTGQWHASGRNSIRCIPRMGGIGQNINEEKGAKATSGVETFRFE